MPEFISKGGTWLRPEQIQTTQPKPMPKPVVEAVKEDIAKVENIVKPATKSKPKPKKRGR